VVFAGEGRAEERHDSVAHDLIHRALVAVDRLHNPLQDGVEELPSLLGVAVGEQLHRALQIGEEDRDLLPLAFQGGLGGEDLLGEVLGSVALRARRAPGSRKKRLGAAGERQSACRALAVGIDCSVIDR
jgi:hypothetical protein